MRIRNIQRFVLALALVVGYITGPNAKLAVAQAQNISGIWDAAANNTTGVLDITQTGNNVISGMIFGDEIEGQYTPAIRRLVFVRLQNGTPFQLYEAHVSADGLRLAGSLMVWNSRGGAGAGGLDFNFSAMRNGPDTATLTIEKTGNGSGTVTSNPTGIDCGVDCSESYPEGERVELTPQPDAGSAFTAWSGDCPATATGMITITMDRDMTCVAEFVSDK